MLNSISAIHAEYPLAPTSPVSGSKLWLDSSDASTFTYSSGSLVSQWSDKSGNSYAFTQGTVGKQPSRSGSQNGLTTVVFDGTDDIVTGTSAASVWKFLHDGTGATVFVAAKQTFASNFSSGSLLSTYGFYATTNTGAGITLGRYSGTTSSEHIATVFNGTSGAYVTNSLFNTTTGNQYAIATYNFDTNNATDASKLAGYLNNGSVDSSQAYSWTSSSTSNPTATLQIGCESSSISPFKGEIAEILIYTSILNATDRNANIAYLKNKWGI